jgi:hypothetical protein
MVHSEHGNVSSGFRKNERNLLSVYTEIGSSKCSTLVYGINSVYFNIICLFLVYLSRRPQMAPWNRAQPELVKVPQVFLRPGKYHYHTLKSPPIVRILNQTDLVDKLTSILYDRL